MISNLFIFIVSQNSNIHPHLTSAIPGDVSVYKFPRMDADDIPMPETAIYKPLKNQDQVETDGATLRLAWLYNQSHLEKINHC